jgi:hypothetical protein
MTFSWVLTIILQIEQIIEQVDRTRRETKRDKGKYCAFK